MYACIPPAPKIFYKYLGVPGVLASSLLFLGAYIEITASQITVKNSGENCLQQTISEPDRQMSLRKVLVKGSEDKEEEEICSCLLSRGKQKSLIKNPVCIVELRTKNHRNLATGLRNS